METTSNEIKKTLRELIGTPIKGSSSVKDCAFTDKGVYIGVLYFNHPTKTGEKDENGEDKYESKPYIESVLDSPVEIFKNRDGKTGIIYSPKDYFNSHFYMENDEVKIISSIRGDDYGTEVFQNVFISSGHDGNYLYDIKNPEINNL